MRAERGEISRGGQDVLRDVANPDVAKAPESSRPAGAVALDLACDSHGRLMRFWMSRQAQGTTLYGGERSKGACRTRATGDGALVVTCVEQGCQASVRLTSEWLVARLRQVRADFEAGRGPSISWSSLSQLGASAQKS
jgi:hypothetical protein